MPSSPSHPDLARAATRRRSTVLELGFATLLTLTLVGARGAAAVGTWQPIGPTGGGLHALVADPSQPKTLYAGAFGSGVWKSPDGGATWGDLADSTTISGATTMVLQVSDIMDSQNGRLVRAVVTNSAGSVTSNVAQLVVLPRPANDDFASAFTIPAGTSTIAGESFGATVEIGEPLHDTVGSDDVDDVGREG